MARLRMRLIRIGDRDGLGTSEATRTRGGPSVSGSKSAHRHDLARYEQGSSFCPETVVIALRQKCQAAHRLRVRVDVE